VEGTMLVAAGSAGTFRLASGASPTPAKIPGVDIPPSDSFTHLAVDSSGTLWVAPGATPFLKNIDRVAALGVFALKDDQWMQFPSGANGLLYPSEAGSGYVSVAIDAHNRVWLGAWGAGISVIDQSTGPPSIWGLYAGSSGLTGLIDAPSYLVAESMLRAPSGEMLVGLFHSLAFAFPPDYEPGGPPATAVAGPFIASGDIPNAIDVPYAIALDRYGVLWIGTDKDGVILIDAGGTPTDGSDDQFAGTLVEEGAGSGVGLASRFVTCIAVARDGTVWVGTDKGLTAFTGTYNRAMNLYSLSSRQYTTADGLPSNKIQALVVDSLNAKWVGTDAGLARISPSGQTTSLPANRLVDPAGNVVSLAFDARRGYLWIGTPRGLNRYEAYPPEGGPAQLVVQPSQNPFHIALTLQGRDYVLSGDPLTLVVPPGSTVRIYTLTGELVWERTDGGIGQLAWDGRTLGGAKVVASGVYLYVAELAGQRTVGKIAVLRDAR